MRESLTLRVNAARMEELRWRLMQLGGFLGVSFSDHLMRHVGADNIQTLLDAETAGDILIRFTWNNGIPANIQQKIMAMQVEIEASHGHALPMFAKALPEAP